MLEVISVVKLVLVPSPEIGRILDGQSRILNWLYNHLLAQANLLRDQYRDTQNSAVAAILYTHRGLRNLVPDIKAENLFLKTVHSSPLKNAALRLSDCIMTYQKSRQGKRLGKVTGWPRFRSWKTKWFSLFYDEPGKGFRVEKGFLILSLGRGLDKQERVLKIPLLEASILNGKTIRSLRITKQGNVYSAVFTVVRTLPEAKPVRKIIALDPNHKNFAYGVDNEGKAVEIERLWWLKTYDKRIDELKAKRDRKQRKSQFIAVLNKNGEPTGTHYYQASRRYQKIQKTLEHVLYKRREQTKVFMHTLAHSLYRQYDLVGIGDYTPHGGGITTPMRRAMNSRSLIGRFKEVAAWTAQKSGKQFAEFDERGTTRTCHECGQVVEGGLQPTIREWSCESCHTHHIRDENAAINGLRRILGDASQKRSELSERVPGSGHFSVKERWVWRVGPRGVHCTSRGTGSSLMSSRQKIKRKAWEPSPSKTIRSVYK